MNILVTGGAGYIGSFIVRALEAEGFTPVIIDNLSSGHEEAVKGYKLYKIDIAGEKEKLDEIIKNENIEGVIHMASYIRMGESYEKPLKYFKNNVVSAINLLDSMRESNVGNIVFSSSAGVYGTPEKLPLEEDDKKSPENPYGETKLMIEKILGWCDKAWGLKSVSIRYFNAAGAALDGSIGEDHPNESHIIPLIIKAALRGKKFTIFGDDYDTKDGTCVRDYVHVLDLAKAHTLSLKYLMDKGESDVFNAGCGKGFSNKEIVEKVKEVAGGFEWQVGPRRKGDAGAFYASINKIKTKLGWEPTLGLDEIIKSAYTWHKSHPDGYSS
jgi:UDP-glucose 4-epimerase